MEKTRKKEILLDSFNTLKNNLLDNSDHIEAIIEKLMAIDPDTAYEVWKYVVSNADLSADYNTSLGYTRTVIYKFHEEYGRTDILEAILAERPILKKIYKDNVAPDFDTVGYLFNEGRLDTVNTILEYVYTNPFHEQYKEEPFAEYLDHLVYLYFKNWNDTSVEFVLNWVEKLKLENSAARIKVRMIDYL